MTDTLPGLATGSATEQEILRQPAVWRRTAALVAERRPALDAFLRPLLERRDLRIVLSGAGTSAFVGEILAPVLTARLARRFDAVATTDIVSSPREYLGEDVPTLLVSFARSGGSPESVAATDVADAVLADVHHLVVTCDAGGALHEHHRDRERSFSLVLPEDTNDSGFAMTSAFTSMLLAGLLALTGDDGAAVEAVAAAGKRVLAERRRVVTLAETAPTRVVALGSGPLRGLARESALKLLELTAGRIVTLFDSALGFRHGPKAVLDDRTLVLLYVSSDPYTRRYDVDMARELAASLDTDHLLVVSAGEAVEGGWAIEGLNGLDDAHLVPVFVLVAQLLGLHASHRLGLDIDNPFPDGSLNRVVRGVTVHPLPGRA